MLLKIYHIVQIYIYTLLIYHIQYYNDIINLLYINLNYLLYTNMGQYYNIIL